MEPDAEIPDPWTDSARRAVARHDPGPTPFRRLWARFVAGCSRLVIRRLNSLTVAHPERVAAARIPGRGLLTFSNHVGLYDDPLLTACLTEPDWDSMRWIAADALNFFGSPFRAWLFNAGKCIPVVRGAGLDQPGMHFMAERLRAGDWVHVFPEGGRTRDPGGWLRRPLKPGMSWLIRESRPILLPWSHLGMRDVLPIGALLPRTGNRIAIHVGEAVDSDLGLADRSVGEITAWAEERLLELEAALRGTPGAVARAG